MRKILISIIGTLSIYSAFADNIPTSKNYVDNALALKQDKIAASDTTMVLTNTGTAGEYETQGIYDATGSYATQSDALVDAITMNAAVQNAIDSEFQCVEWDENNECLLMDVFGTPQQQILPNGFTALEYLESTGTQYIDTGITPTNETGLMVKFNKYALARTGCSSDQVVVGSVRSSESASDRLYVNPASRLYLVFAQSFSDDNAIYGSYSYDTDYDVSINYKNNRKRFVNGLTAKDIITTFSGPSVNLYLFAGSRPQSANWYFCGRIYYLQITEGTNIVRNFIPARRDSDGVLGMYDTVTNTFFTNNGTGEFIGGPVVNLYLPVGE